MTKKFRKTAAFVTSLTVLCCSAQLSVFADDTMITPPYIPEGIEVAPEDTVEITEKDVDADLYTICDNLRDFATDKNAVYVSKKDGIVVFGSEKQEEIDKAKAYCQDNKIDSKYVFFILIEEEMPVEPVVTTTAGYIPDGLETETTTVTTTVTVPVVDVDLNEICDNLKDFATDKNAVYVSKKDGIVVFGSENQEEINKAKAYCDDNKIDSKYVFFILIEEEMPVEPVVTTTAGYIPDGLETETTTVTTTVTVPVVDVDLNEICNNLREFATDKNSVYVSKKDGIVVFGSEKQEEIDKAKAYCQDNKIDSKYVYFILIQPETDYVSDHTLIVSLFSDYFKANNLNASVFDDANESGKVIVDYDYTNPEYSSIISSFIAENNIDSNEVEIRIREDATEELPQTGMPYARAVEGITALLTLGGAALIIKSRKENDET